MSRRPKHRRTDPVCREFVAPIGWWSWRRFDRHRGEQCPVCYHPHPGTWIDSESERCTCPTGDGSLRWPCPAHPPTHRSTDPESEDEQ